MTSGITCSATTRRSVSTSPRPNPTGASLRIGTWRSRTASFGTCPPTCPWKSFKLSTKCSRENIKPTPVHCGTHNPRRLPSPSGPSFRLRRRALRRSLQVLYVHYYTWLLAVTNLLFLCKYYCGQTYSATFNAHPSFFYIIRALLSFILKVDRRIW